MQDREDGRSSGKRERRRDLGQNGLTVAQSQGLTTAHNLWQQVLPSSHLTLAVNTF